MTLWRPPRDAQLGGKLRWQTVGSFEAAVEELVSGVARPSAMELAYAAAKQALFELAGRRTASWRAAVAPLTSQAPNGQDRLLARPETAPPTGAGRGPRRRQPAD